MPTNRGVLERTDQIAVATPRHAVATDISTFAGFELPDSFTVQAEGVVPYKYFTVPTNFTEDKWVRACDAVDLGCGAGNHALWLVSRGFRMTGIDISSEAIEVATRLAGTR